MEGCLDKLSRNSLEPAVLLMSRCLAKFLFIRVLRVMVYLWRRLSFIFENVLSLLCLNTKQKGKHMNHSLSYSG